MYKSQEEHDQDYAERYAGKFVADGCDDESDEGLRNAFESCVMPANPALYPRIRQEIKNLRQAIEARERMIEVLGCDPIRNRVKCSRCEQWAPNADAVAVSEEAGVWCPNCANGIAATGFFPDEIEVAGMFADELVNGGEIEFKVLNGEVVRQ